MLKLLFICTHNRCRSILSEAITNHLGGDVLQARSAGSQPCGEVHPLSLKYLAEANISTHGLQSQSWDEFESYTPDIVITVCDSAAKETCPLWFGNHLQIHWALKDPSKIEGSDEEKAQAFGATIREIEQRTKALLQLPLAQLSLSERKQALTKLGAEVKA